MNVSKERQGVLFILVGPGGVGKNALLNAILHDFDDLKQLPTATTRSIRPDEQEGREHQFVSLDSFKQMIADDALIEYQEVHPGKFYGVPRATVEDAIKEGHDLIADIEVLGASIIRQQYPHNSVMIFIAPPSTEALVKRLNNRDASAEDIADRLNRLPMEMRYAPVSNYVIVNDDIETAINQLRGIIQQERDLRTTETLPYTGVNVYFTVSVDIVRGDEQLIPPNEELRVQIKSGEMPASAALRVLDNTLSLSVDESKLIYGPPDKATTHSSALSIQYDGEAKTYSLVYHFIYLLPDHVNAPEGWEWEPYAAGVPSEVGA